MKKIIEIEKSELDLINNLLSMTGEEIYDKYGYKRDETITKTVAFGDGLEADIKLVICDGDDKPYTEGVLFKNGSELCFTDCDDEFTGEWEFEYEDETYIVEVKEKE